MSLWNIKIALSFLNLSAAFDTINHLILLDRLKEWFCLGGDELEWVVSYFKHCFQSVQISSIHLYADDSQDHNSFNRSHCNDSIRNFLVSVQEWVYKNKLKLNPDKTEVREVPHSLCSARAITLSQPNTSGFGACDWVNYSPKVWNTLLASINCAGLVPAFPKALKTHNFTHPP